MRTPASLAGLPLSPMEFAVLRYAALGCTNQQTANRLRLAENTVKTHRRRLSVKLGAVNITHAVSIAHRRGILAGAAMIRGEGA